MYLVYEIFLYIAYITAKTRYLNNTITCEAFVTVAYINVLLVFE